MSRASLRRRKRRAQRHDTPPVASYLLRGFDALRYLLLLLSGELGEKRQNAIFPSFSPPAYAIIILVTYLSSRAALQALHMRFRQN